MNIGCVKEIKPQEYRVGMTPDNAHDFVAHHHTVMIEAGAVKAPASPTKRTRPPEPSSCPVPKGFGRKAR